MSVLSVPETIAGLFLVFFAPGYAVTRALFPEWRLRGPTALRRLVETLTLSFVLSVVLTVLVGYLLLALAPGGFQAFWSDPVLELSLFGVTVAGLIAATARGAFARHPPAVRPGPDVPSGEEGAWELSLELDRLRREERKLLHALRAPKASPAETGTLQEKLRQVRERATDLARRREADYGE
jgi:Protein of unknown function (DUF1616)